MIVIKYGMNVKNLAEKVLVVGEKFLNDWEKCLIRLLWLGLGRIRDGYFHGGKGLLKVSQRQRERRAT